MNAFYQKSQQAELVHADFRTTFSYAQRGDVIYCDPPYVPLETKQQVIPYTNKIFTLDDQIELVELAKATAAKGIPVLLSNHDTPFTRHYYQQAQISCFRVSRFINCNIDDRQPVHELLALFT